MFFFFFFYTYIIIQSITSSEILTYIRPIQVHTHLEQCSLEADIFSGIPRDGKQNRYESRDWDGRGKNVIGSGRDRE